MDITKLSQTKLIERWYRAEEKEREALFALPDDLGDVPLHHLVLHSQSPKVVAYGKASALAREFREEKKSRLRYHVSLKPIKRKAV